MHYIGKSKVLKNSRYINGDICVLFFSIFEGAANNLPDESSHYAAQQILQVCCSSTADDTVLALVSGGGSALLPIPMDGITLQEKIEVQLSYMRFFC